MVSKQTNEVRRWIPGDNYSCTCTYMHNSTHVHVHTCIIVHMYIHIHVHTCIIVHMYIHIHVHDVELYRCTHNYIYMFCMCTYLCLIFSYTCIRMYMYICKVLCNNRVVLTRWLMVVILFGWEVYFLSCTCL